MSEKKYAAKITVGMASCGIAAGAREVFNTLKAAVKELPLALDFSGCMGMCYNEPLMEMTMSDGSRYLYCQVTPDKAKEIVNKYMESGKPVSEWLAYAEDRDTADKSFLVQQQRILLKNCGIINPESLQSYLAVDGYAAIKKALRMHPEQVIREIIDSGLRGRGGGGFPTGTKWALARKTLSQDKYLICNADEGDPGAFMDRSVLESNPHALLEGMLIGGYAIGAQQGYVYIRAEYPLAIKRLSLAIAQAREEGYLGRNILGHGFDFDINIREGAGAFVCGEETALIMSIEGKRGMPRIRPPYPAESGLWGEATSINNVETLANVPWIMLNGVASFNQYGTEKSKGTKVFALAGNIARGGLIEVPMGMTINQIVFDIGGGLASGKALKAVQTGGPSGGCIPAKLADTPIDYESLKKIGAIMGSGGLLIMDDTTCMVDVAKFFLNFTQEESCGKCTFCRVGTRRMLEILERITQGEGKEGDLELLEELGQSIIAGSLCGLGQSAPNPVLTTIKYFREEYEAHIYHKLCPAKKCKALIRMEVVEERCKGCGRCSKECPTDAISGEKKQPFTIEQEKCIRCGLCVSACKSNAILIYPGARGEEYNG
ncbi:NADH-quinone oxidoreductase subunit NuoF [Metallumcola ferriviriculae]|uniref:NADH-quinone oxidoreductase subunit NuoF n=1 Tax=Metallumcola ferriviriculae TaxID=3039180 RepID=A0AAU0UQL6_9FIRM|nr:NADH-quinone oxidoreductase subunit NuoF [Desulfitibacteraceae bacterium MK1]